MKRILFIVILAGMMWINRYSAINQPPPGDPGVPVLVYHHLLHDEENKYFRNNEAVITPAQFSEQMKYLHDHGYHTVTLEQLERYLEGDLNLPAKSVVITFDDGYLSNFHYAYPILKTYHFKAAIFAITGNIRSSLEPFDPDRLNFISWPEIPRFADVFEVHGHTHRMHRNILNISDLVWKTSSAITGDLQRSRQVLPSRYFAYPYGQYTKRTKKIVAEAGYRLAFTIQGQRVYRNSPRLELGRYWIGPDMTLEQFAEIINR